MVGPDCSFKYEVLRNIDVGSFCVGACAVTDESLQFLPPSLELTLVHAKRQLLHVLRYIIYSGIGQQYRAQPTAS